MQIPLNFNYHSALRLTSEQHGGLHCARRDEIQGVIGMDDPSLLISDDEATSECFR